MSPLPPNLPRRKATIRYPGHDYSTAGTYFVTICTQDRRELFGRVREGRMSGNDVAIMIDAVWQGLPGRFPGVGLDAMTIMPDHLHGVVMIRTDPDTNEAPTLGSVIKYFKGQTSIRYFEQARIGNWPPVNQRLWQRQYYDRIVRSARELEQIRFYIETNPERWWARRGE